MFHFGNHFDLLLTFDNFNFQTESSLTDGQRIQYTPTRFRQQIVCGGPGFDPRRRHILFFGHKFPYFNTTNLFSPNLTKLPYYYLELIMGLKFVKYMVQTLYVRNIVTLRVTKKICCGLASSERSEVLAKPNRFFLSLLKLQYF